MFPANDNIIYFPPTPAKACRTGNTVQLLFFLLSPQRQTFVAPRRSNARSLVLALVHVATKKEKKDEAEDEETVMRIE